MQRGKKFENDLQDRKVNVLKKEETKNDYGN